MTKRLFAVNILGQSFETVTMTAGVLAFPITFIVTDVMNEYYGKRGIRFVTLVGMVMIVLEFALLQLALAVPAAPTSPKGAGCALPAPRSAHSSLTRPSCCPKTETM